MINPPEGAIILLQHSGSSRPADCREDYFTCARVLPVFLLAALVLTGCTGQDSGGEGDADNGHEDTHANINAAEGVHPAAQGEEIAGRDQFSSPEDLVSALALALTLEDFDAIYARDAIAQHEVQKLLETEPLFKQERVLKEHYEGERRRFFMGSPGQRYLAVAQVIAFNPRLEVIEIEHRERALPVAGPNANIPVQVVYVRAHFDRISEAPPKHKTLGAGIGNYRVSLLKETVLEIEFDGGGQFVSGKRMASEDALWPAVPLELTAVTVSNADNYKRVWIKAFFIGDEPLEPATARIADHEVPLSPHNARWLRVITTLDADILNQGNIPFQITLHNGATYDMVISGFGQQYRERYYVADRVSQVNRWGLWSFRSLDSDFPFGEGMAHLSLR